MPLGMLGKYERLDVLGHGASGIVYLAKDTLLGKLVALKEVSAQGEERERFVEEARVLDRLHHPNIVQVNGVDVIEGKVVIDMEYIRGRNLQDILREHPQLPVADALDIAAQICEGLAYAHANRTVHRDVKPANILISHDGRVKLVDFGLAQVLGTNSFAGGAGTYAYMAPEDFEEHEQSNRQSDIWAAGIILYEMLAGRRPFGVARAKDPFAWKRAIETEPLDPVSGVRSDTDPETDDIIGRALARSRAQRYEDAAVMAADLRRIIKADPAHSVADLVGVAAPTYTNLPSYTTLVDEDAPTIAASPATLELAGVLMLPGAPPMEDIDGFLMHAPDHWLSAKTALLSGALVQWLRTIGETPLADVAEKLVRERPMGGDEDHLLRDFLYRAGLDTMDEAHHAFEAGVRCADDGRHAAAVPFLRRAAKLDPMRAVYHQRLGRALRDSGDRDAAVAALEEGLVYHPTDKTLTRDHTELTGAKVALSSQTVDFGTVRKGETRSSRITLRNSGVGTVQGRVASAPGWVRVEPASFTTRQKQPLTLTADAGGVWQAPAQFDEIVVLETTAGREEIGVRLQVLPPRRGFWQIFYWYFPALLAALLPGTAGVFRQISNSSTNLWQPAAAETGLLCGSLFVLSVAADTVLAWRVIPVLLLLLNVAGAAGILSDINSGSGQLAQSALVRTAPIALLLLVLQSAALAFDPRRLGRWQVWVFVLIAAGILGAYTITQI